MSEKIKFSLAILASSAAGSVLWWTLQKPHVLEARPPRSLPRQTVVLTPVPEAPPLEEPAPQPTLVEVDT
ncbi:MAG TPA: hypothetical protein VJ276_08100, partial [Thermoanaerobaculia bacterium]|nr:hypothetical protein [Thermoanaerobaculia bacterium]